MAGGIEVAQAYVTIIPSMKDSQKTIAKELNADAIGNDAGSKMGEGISSGLSAKAMAMGTVFGNLVTSAASKALSGVGDVLGGIYEGFADNEQLVGGMQKLFGDSADTVIANANNAFMTAGKSANNYMESVTSISASLVNSVGGDTEEAARLADVAMRAMSDNVNTFGTDAQNVENAFMGMAKGNFSMLDNLSLGFAGTQQGMVDLINASGVLDHQLESTKDLADVGFGTMVEAVQAVQEQMGVAGTTAKEAMGTMSGSVEAAKSAWDNVLTAVGSGDSQQLASAASGLVDAMFGALDSETGKREGGVVANFTRLVTNAFQTVGGLIPGLAQQALAALPESISAPLQNIFDNIAPLVAPAAEALQKGFGNAVKTLAPVVSGAMGTVLGVISDVMDFITAYVLPVAQSVWDTISPVIGNILDDVMASFPAIQETITTAFDAVMDVVEDVWPDVQATVETATELISGAIETAWPVIESVVGTAMNGIKAVMEVVWPIVANLVRRGVRTIRTILEGIGPVVGKVRSVFNRVKEAIAHPIETARNLIKTAIDKIKSIIGGVKLQLPHINLPHFSVSGGKAPWGIGGKGSLPSFSVNWYAHGGYVDQPTLFGAGERGGELIWPSYEPYLDRYADALAERIDGGGVNVYLTYNGSGDADELVRTLTRDLRMLRATGAI